MNARTLTRIMFALLLAALWVTGAATQTTPTAQNRKTPDSYPPALPDREGPPPPRLIFEEISEISLPGPLSEAPVRGEDGTVRLPVNGGLAIVTLEPQISVRISETLPSTTVADGGIDAGWVLSEDGRFRYRTQPSGEVLAQRLRRKGWRKAWRIHVSGSTPAPPLPGGRRLFFGSVDNQVYAVRSDNGHRLWASDVGDRVSRALTLWRGEVEPENGSHDGPIPVELVLLVPDGGGQIVALDSHDGSRLATLELPSEEDRLVPPASPPRTARSSLRCRSTTPRKQR